MDLGVMNGRGAHGFRKFYKSRAEQVMKPINVEITMGHNIGVSASYYRPLEKDVLQDYLKAVDELTIDGDTKSLQKQVVELEEKRMDSEYIIQAKLREKEGEIEELKSQMSDVLTTLKMAKTREGVIANNRTILDSKRRVTFGYIGDDNELVNVKIPIDSVEIQ